jgi:hypothetical protein
MLGRSLKTWTCCRRCEIVKIGGFLAACWQTCAHFWRRLCLPAGNGTRVSIVHHGLPSSEARRHALGWRHYLARLRLVGEGKGVDAHVTPPELIDRAD